MFFPFHLTAGYWPALWNALMQEVTDEHFREEMRLQIELAGGDCSPRTLKRLQEIGPAARAFLARQRFLTSLGQNPIIHWCERYWLQVFILNFIGLERDLARQAQLKHAHWRERHEERLVGIIAANDHQFGQVVGFGQLPAPLQAQVVQGFAAELGMPNATGPSIQQMG